MLYSGRPKATNLFCFALIYITHNSAPRSRNIVHNMARSWLFRVCVCLSFVLGTAGGEIQTLFLFSLISHKVILIFLGSFKSSSYIKFIRLIAHRTFNPHLTTVLIPNNPPFQVFNYCPSTDYVSRNYYFSTNHLSDYFTARKAFFFFFLNNSYLLFIIYLMNINYCSLC